MTNSTPNEANPYDPPLKITIPLPTEIPRARGIHATTGYGKNLRVRCTDHEHDLIEQESQQLGLTVAGFGRFVMRSVAKALKDHREHGSSSVVVELIADVQNTETRRIGTTLTE